MPIKRKHGVTARRLSENNRMTLLIGPHDPLLPHFDDYYPVPADELDSLPAQLHEAARFRMRADWERNRQELLNWWNAGADAVRLYPRFFKPWNYVSPRGPEVQPWAAIEFDQPQTKEFLSHLKKDLR